MTRRILCPFHAERTPSCIVYLDGYKCHGCGKAGPLSDLGERAPTEPLPPKKIEDIAARMQYIRSLPVRSVRGLQLHADEEFYYVVWPEDKYYNARRFAEANYGQKYKCPSGVPRPIFAAQTRDTGPLVLVEGEINALSVAAACPDLSVMSPGGSGDFYSPRMQKDLSLFDRYGTIFVVADQDPAGAIACIQAKSLLSARDKGRIRDIRIHLMREDANECLVKYGSESLKKEIYRALGMPEGLPPDGGAMPTPGRAAA